MAPEDCLDVLDLYARTGTPGSFDTLLLRLDHFPQGQWVVESLVTGEVQGTAGSAIVSLSAPVQGAAWEAPCPDGAMGDHDPLNGDVLWGLCVVAPTDAGWQDVIVALDEARRALADRMGIRRLGTLVRLQGSGGTALNMAPERFAKTVNAGKVAEPILRLLLKRGYQLDASVTLPDGTQAAVLSWANPRAAESWIVRHGPAVLQPDVDNVETAEAP
jgi:hypothetical protein